MPPKRSSLSHLASPQRVVARYLSAASKGMPRVVGSEYLLKRQGLIPVDVFYGEVRPREGRSVVMQGEDVQNVRTGETFTFVGLDGRGEAILASSDREYKILQAQLEKDRLHVETEGLSVRSGAWIPGEIRDNNMSLRTNEDVKGDEGSQVPPARDSYGNELYEEDETS